MPLLPAHLSALVVQGMFRNTLLIIAMCATSILLYALLLVIGVQPWWSPQYLIPILGEPGWAHIALIPAVVQALHVQYVMLVAGDCEH
jgi:hypothetical protein